MHGSLNSLRIQIAGVSYKKNIPDLRESPALKLIKEFEYITGIPVLLNTSFNLNGEPIVMSPTDAIRTFYSCGLDILVIGDFVTEKN